MSHPEALVERIGDLLYEKFFAYGVNGTDSADAAEKILDLFAMREERQFMDDLGDLWNHSSFAADKPVRRFVLTTSWEATDD